MWENGLRRSLTQLMREFSAQLNTTRYHSSESCSDIKHDWSSSYNQVRSNSWHKQCACVQQPRKVFTSWTREFSSKPEAKKLLLVRPSFATQKHRNCVRTYVSRWSKLILLLITKNLLTFELTSCEHPARVHNCRCTKTLGQSIVAYDCHSDVWTTTLTYHSIIRFHWRTLNINATFKYVFTRLINEHT